MISKNIIYLTAAAAGVLLISMTVASLWSDHRIKEMERTVAVAKERADAVEHTAADKEQKTAEYKAKIEYLENKLVEISATARRQDEELESLSANTTNARNDVDRARRVRSVAATADELCAKLEELGHPCG
jgi:uncharacterized coiled-coil protein SlyX